jgi:hypothetical protein
VPPVETVVISSDEEEPGKGLAPAGGSSRSSKWKSDRARPALHNTSGRNLNVLPKAAQERDGSVIDLDSSDESLSFPSKGQSLAGEHTNCVTIGMPSSAPDFHDTGRRPNPSNIDVGEQLDIDLPDPLDLFAESGDTFPDAQSLQVDVESPPQNVQLQVTHPVVQSNPEPSTFEDQVHGVSCLLTKTTAPPLGLSDHSGGPFVIGETISHSLSSRGQDGRRSGVTPLPDTVAMSKLNLDGNDTNIAGSSDSALPLLQAPSRSGFPAESQTTRPPAPPLPRLRSAPVVVVGPYNVTEALWNFAYRRRQRQTTDNGSSPREQDPKPCTTTAKEMHDGIGSFKQERAPVALTDDYVWKASEVAAEQSSPVWGLPPADSSSVDAADRFPLPHQTVTDSKQVAFCMLILAH